MKKLILISIIIMLSITCFSQERQWKKTLKANTISYYKWFLNKYPESEFSEEATQKIIDLEFKKVQLIDTEAAYKNFLSDYGDNDYTNSDFVTKAREKIENFERQNNEKQKEIERRQKEKEKKLNSQIDKTRNYKIEEFTEKQFFDDGWNTKDAFEGKTGIVKMIYTIEKLEITLGVIGNVGGELGSEMKSLGFLAEQAYKNGKPYNYNMNAKDKICVFTFENGILVKKNYLLDSATIDEKKVLLTKNQNQVQTGTPDEILMDALKAKDYKNALILVQKVDSVNYSDDKNNSLLMFASAFEHTEVVKVLLDKGANVDLQETSVVLS